MTLSRVGFLANTSISGQSVRIATLHETHTILVSSYHHRVPLDPEGSKRMMEARQARVHYGQGSDSDVVWRFRYPGTCYWPQHRRGIASCPNVWKCLLVAQWVIYVLHVRGTRTKEVEGPRLSPMWTTKRVPKKYSWSPEPFIEPDKPLFQVGYHQKVMFSRVAPVGPLVFLVDRYFDCCHFSRWNE